MVGALARSPAIADPADVRDLRIDGSVEAATAYSTLVAAWGSKLVIEGELPPVLLRVDLERVTRDEALDLLTNAAGHFWWVDERGVVRVALDWPNNRFRAERIVRRSYSLRRAIPSEVRAALRQLSTATRIDALDGGVSADIHERMASWADRVVAAMEGPLPAEGAVYWFGSEAQMRSAAPDPRLGSERRRSLWYPRLRPREELHHNIEALFDVELVLDPAILDAGLGSLQLEQATLFEALDALTVPEGRFWSVLEGRRILIARDTSWLRRHWEPYGLLAVPLRHADPGSVRSILSDLVHVTAKGSSPPVAMALGRPDDLALARFVIDTLDRDPAVTVTPSTAARLWLGSGFWSRSDAQFLVDPRVDVARRRSYVAVLPPELGPIQERLAAAGKPATARANRSQQHVVGMLETELGLHVGVTNCEWRVDPYAISDEGPLDGGRVAVLQRLAAQHALLWTVVGPDTVRLTADLPYYARYAPHGGVAAVSLGSANAGAIRELAARLGLEHAVEVAGPKPLLFAVGRWSDLEALLAVAGGAAPSSPAK